MRQHNVSSRGRVVKPSWYTNRFFWMGFGLFACLLIAYSMWSKSAWDKVAYSSKVKASVIAQVEMAFALPTNSGEEREAKKEALAKVIQVAAGSNDLCFIPEMITWQQVINNLEVQKQRCNENKDKIQQLEQNLQPVLLFLQDDANVAKALSGLQTQKSEIAEGEFTAIAALWNNTTQDVSSVMVSEHFAPVKESLVTSLQAGSAKWREMLAAHEAKDKGRFVKAQQEIAVAYDHLFEVREIEQQELVKYIESFRHTLVKLY